MTPRTLFPLALLAPALALTACKSSQPKGLPKKLPNVNVSSSAAPPKHNMNRGEYPFDARGNYITAWAAEGSRGAGNIPAPQPRYEEPPPVQPEPVSRKSRSERNASSSRMVVSTAPPPQQQQPVQPQPPPQVRMTSTAPAPSRTAPTVRVSPPSQPTPRPAVASTTPKPAPKPAPKPKPKPAPSVITHTVKSGDTLYGLALRYKSTVAKIKAASGISSDLLQIGQKLKIPR